MIATMIASMSNTNRFYNPAKASLFTAFRAVIVAAWTVVFTPDHADRVIHDQVATKLLDHPQVVNPQLSQELERIVESINTKGTSFVDVRVGFKDRLGIFACLMQFSMYDRSMSPFMVTKYETVDELYRSITAKSSSGPLSLSQQLDLALDTTDGNVHEAVWRLFVTARQYSRWYDQESIIGMPEISKPLAIDRMVGWSSSVMALKPYQPGVNQDTSGDVYYVWTHALAKLVFGRLSPWYALDARLMQLAVHIGTWLNHNIAHKVSPQTVNSDHTIAAAYGNAIGRVVAKNI